MIALIEDHQGARMPLLHTKETGGGHESPITAFILSPSCPQGSMLWMQPQSTPASSPAILCQSLWRRGRALSLLTCFPYALAFLFIFLMYCLFPCVKGDLPLTFWANLLATDYFPLNTNCHQGDLLSPPLWTSHLSTLQQNLAGSRW